MMQPAPENDRADELELLKASRLYVFKAVHMLAFTLYILLMVVCDLTILSAVIFSIDWMEHRIKAQYKFLGIDVQAIIYHVDVVVLFAFAAVLAYKVLKHLYVSVRQSE